MTEQNIQNNDDDSLNEQGQNVAPPNEPNQEINNLNEQGQDAKPSWIRRILKVMAVVVLLAMAWVGYEAYRFLTTPASDLPQELSFTIEAGTSFDGVAKSLQEQGFITDVKKFRLLGKYKNSLSKMKAGEFLLSTGWTPPQILDQLTNGKPILHKLVIPEGLAWWQVARIVEEQGFALFDDFKEVVHDAEFLKTHHIPFANAEGFLFPETYALPKPKNMNSAEKKEQARKIASLMVRTFWVKTKPLWEGLPEPEEGETAASALALGHKQAWPLPRRKVPFESPTQISPKALYTWVTLASLVEKETSIPSERVTVAGVFANRLRVGMLLQCDPTIAYGIGESFSGSIRRSHLQDEKNPYNTYVYGGLPPSPIASSGLATLDAAMNPAKHGLYYFVATGDGGHTFSRSLQEHSRAVQDYRRIVRSGD